MPISSAGASIAQMAVMNTQQQASQQAVSSLSSQGSNGAATSDAAAGAAATGTAPLASQLSAAAAQSSAGAATTTSTTTKAADGTTTTTQQTKPAEPFNAPLLKLPARAKMMDVVNAMHVAAKSSNATTAEALEAQAAKWQEDQQTFLTSIQSIIWGTG